MCGLFFVFGVFYEDEVYDIGEIEDGVEGVDVVYGVEDGGEFVGLWFVDV